MKKKNYLPYNFDEKYEYRTYFNIGTRYRDSFFGKKQKENGNKYRDLDTYLSWKNYFFKKYLNKCSLDSKCNFAHYLNKKAEFYKMKLEIIKAIAIPVYVLEITAFVTVLSNEFRNLYMLIFLIVLLCFLIVIGISYIEKYERKVRFYKDCIVIINDNISSHQK